MTKLKVFLKDLLERVGKTFVGAAVPAFVLPAFDAYNLAAWKGAVFTAVAVGMSAVFSLLSKQFGGKDTASLVKGIENAAPKV